MRLILEMGQRILCHGKVEDIFVLKPSKERYLLVHLAITFSSLLLDMKRARNAVIEHHPYQYKATKS
jgi:hypothetical protein